MKIRFFVICLVVFGLVGCATVQTLSPTTEIIGMKARDTVLIVTEQFSRGGNTLPKGKYYPALEVAKGYVIYHYPEPIKVKVFG